MRKTDVIFLGTIIIMLLILIISLTFNIWIKWFEFWWMPLVPIALAKAFFPNSKFVD